MLRHRDKRRRADWFEEEIGERNGMKKSFIYQHTLLCKKKEGEVSLGREIEIR